MDCDEISHSIMTTDKSLIGEIKKHFPTAVDAKGVVDRAQLGKLIFQDPKKRKLLNKLTH